MARIITFARACHAVYGDDPQVPRWTRIAFKKSTGGLFGAFQAAAFQRGSRVIVAFKSTNGADVVADLKQGAGMNTNQYASASTFVTNVAMSASSIAVCGHSLGGAIAQVIGNRYDYPFVTFNAPGVGLISRNLREIDGARIDPAAMLATEAAGSAASDSLAEPAVAVLQRVRGVNFRVGKDAVGSIGTHYGDLIEIRDSNGSSDAGAKHKMESMIAALGSSIYRNRRLASLV